MSCTSHFSQTTPGRPRHHPEVVGLAARRRRHNGEHFRGHVALGAHHRVHLGDARDSLGPGSEKQQLWIWCFCCLMLFVLRLSLIVLFEVLLLFWVMYGCCWLKFCFFFRRFVWSSFLQDMYGYIYIYIYDEHGCSVNMAIVLLTLFIYIYILMFAIVFFQ
jgi:hypothetical protein